MLHLYKVSVNVDQRSLDVIVKVGVVATMETGSHKNKIESPDRRLTVIVGEGKRGMAAWVQAGRFDGNKMLHISHEGWVFEGKGQLNALSSGDPLIVSLARIETSNDDIIKCQEKLTFASEDCCIAYGNGCYVRCCGSCCADPVGCPGARCCG